MTLEARLMNLQETGTAKTLSDANKAIRKVLSGMTDAYRGMFRTGIRYVSEVKAYDWYVLLRDH